MKFDFQHVWENIHAWKIYWWLLCAHEDSKVTKTNSSSKQPIKKDGMISKKFTNCNMKAYLKNLIALHVEKNTLTKV